MSQNIPINRLAIFNGAFSTENYGGAALKFEKI